MGRICTRTTGRLLGGITLMILLSASRPAAANDGFEFLRDFDAALTGTIGYDFITEPGGVSTKHDGTLNIVSVNGISAADLAKQLAQSINTLAGTSVASATGSVVTLNDTVNGVSLNNVSDAGLIRISAEIHSDQSGRIDFGPDPNTGLSVLTTPGSYTIVGPGGLNASFTDPIGTNSSQLAMQLQTTLVSAGYASQLTGSSVLFTPPAPGTIHVEPFGNGIDYIIAVVPEPSAFTFALASGIMVGGCTLYRRRARK